MQYYLWRAATLVLGRLPLAVAYACGDACGRVAFALWPRGRRATIRNYRRVLPGAPPSEVRRVARASFQNYCHYLVDFIRFPLLARAEARPRVSSGVQAETCLQRACEGKAAFAGLQALREKGRGVVLVPMHFGNWDVGAAAASSAGHTITVVADTFEDQRLNSLVVGARERLGMRVVPVQKAGPAAIRALRRGEVVALLIDRPTPGHGVGVSFFGFPVEVPAGPAYLALRTGAALVPCAAPRLGNGTFAFEVVADFSLDTTSTGDRDADVRRLTQALMSAHERFIRRYPDQWYMFREMWPRDAREAPR